MDSVIINFLVIFTNFLISKAKCCLLVAGGGYATKMSSYGESITFLACYTFN